MKLAYGKSSITTIINCIPDLLKMQAERKPSSTAALAPGRTPLTYRRLWEQMEYVLHMLNGMGGDRQGIRRTSLDNL